NSRARVGYFHRSKRCTGSLAVDHATSHGNQPTSGHSFARIFEQIKHRTFDEHRVGPNQRQFAVFLADANWRSIASHFEQGGVRHLIEVRGNLYNYYFFLLAKAPDHAVHLGGGIVKRAHQRVTKRRISIVLVDVVAQATQSESEIFHIMSQNRSQNIERLDSKRFEHLPAIIG